MLLKVNFIFVVINLSKFFTKIVMMNQITFKRLLSAIKIFKEIRLTLLKQITCIVIL